MTLWKYIDNIDENRYSNKFCKIRQVWNVRICSNNIHHTVVSYEVLCNMWPTIGIHIQAGDFFSQCTTAWMLSTAWIFHTRWLQPFAKWETTEGLNFLLANPTIKCSTVFLAEAYAIYNCVLLSQSKRQTRGKSVHSQTIILQYWILELFWVPIHCGIKGNELARLVSNRFWIHLNALSKANPEPAND